MYTDSSLKTCNSVHDLYLASSFADFGLSVEQFEQALKKIAETLLPADTEGSKILAFYRSLHLKDLALAQGCANGSVAAWDTFFNRFRDYLHSTALALTRNEQSARDLSDALAGELYPGATVVNDRRSKLDTYSGRGSLEGWLRALLSHAYIDRHRSDRRFLSLDARTDLFKLLSCGPRTRADLLDDVLETALHEAFGAQTAEDRYLLSAYFFDGCTLKEIGIAIGLHESSVQRRIRATVEKIRKHISRSLRNGGRSFEEIKECMRSDRWEVPVDLRELLIGRLVRE